MLTIGRTHTGKRRDTQDECDVCGVVWLRSELQERDDGILVCPDDRDGRTVKEIDAQRVLDSAGAEPVRGAER